MEYSKSGLKVSGIMFLVQCNIIPTKSETDETLAQITFVKASHVNTDGPVKKPSHAIRTSSVQNKRECLVAVLSYFAVCPARNISFTNLSPQLNYYRHRYHFESNLRLRVNVKGFERPPPVDI